MLIERLGVDKSLRRLCGWSRLGALPSGSTLSRAFTEFSANALPRRMHDALIKKTHEYRLVGHISRDATGIEASKKQLKGADKSEAHKHKRGRPRKGEERPKERALPANNSKPGNANRSSSTLRFILMPKPLQPSGSCWS